jgi:hypothetical protein
MARHRAAKLLDLHGGGQGRRTEESSRGLNRGATDSSSPTPEGPLERCLPAAARLASINSASQASCGSPEGRASRNARPHAARPRSHQRCSRRGCRPRPTTAALLGRRSPLGLFSETPTAWFSREVGLRASGALPKVLRRKPERSPESNLSAYSETPHCRPSGYDYHHSSV